MDRKLDWAAAVFLGLLFLYSFWTFFLVDRNIWLSSLPSYVAVQTSLWQFQSDHSNAVASMFGLLMLSLFVSYGWLVRVIEKTKTSVQQVVMIGMSAVIILCLSYPALSYDVYNYAFNAKMVLVHGVDPHVRTAQEFESNWHLFMRNIHTPAPYGYGWTAISLLPGWLGQWDVKGEIISFRLLMVASLIGLWWVALLGMEKRQEIGFALLVLNPLVLIETVSNIHNDVVMMALALGGLWILEKNQQLPFKLKILTGFGLLGLSVSIKFATIVLLPVYAVVWLLKRWSPKSDGGALMMASLFGLLVTEQSKRFLSWYAIWGFSLIVWTRSTFMRSSAVIVTLAAMLSYVPYLWTGHYTPESQTLRQLIALGIPALHLGWYGWRRRMLISKRLRQSTSK